MSMGKMRNTVERCVKVCYRLRPRLELLLRVIFSFSFFFFFLFFFFCMFARLIAKARIHVTRAKTYI